MEAAKKAGLGLKKTSLPLSETQRAPQAGSASQLAWMTTMLPTAAAAWAALGEGGSPSGVTFSQRPVRTSMMLTSLVAPARRMPADKPQGHECATHPT